MANARSSGTLTRKRRLVVNRLLILACALLTVAFSSCRHRFNDEEKGVSLSLAQERKANIGGVSYNLYFSVPTEREEAIRGESQITFEMLKQAPLVLDFKADKESVQAVYANGEEVPYDFENEHIVIREKYLREGRNSVFIRFTAGEGALNRGEDLLYTLHVPDRCRVLMPCFDQPDIKARFKLMLKVPVTWRAVANGGAVRTEYFEDYKLCEFEETKPLSTYLFAFAAGRFRFTERYVDGRWIGIYYRETDTAKVNASIPEIVNQVSYSLRWLENYTGIRYPFDVYNVVSIPAFQFGGMEHPGATYYLESSLFLDRDADLAAQMRRSNLIAHETAHMWFGDLVTMRWFDDVWLKEVFANFMADKMMVALYPGVDHDLNFYLNHYEAALSTDRTPGANPILQQLDNLENAGTLYGDIIYHKAPITMRMLEQIVSERALQRGLRRYLRAWAFSNASWADLIRILEESSGINLQAWNDVWVKEAGAPVVHFTQAGIEMKDESGQHRTWPQAISVLRDPFGRLRRNIVEIRDTLTPWRTADVILPDGDALGYACFLPTTHSVEFLDDNLSRLQDPLHRAVAWQLLYEGVLHRCVKGEFFVRSCIKHLPSEKNNLIVNRALYFLRTVYNTYLDEGSRQLLQDDLERFCRAMIHDTPEPMNKDLYFKTLVALYASPKVGAQLLGVLKGYASFPGINLDDRDRVSLALNILLRNPSLHDDLQDFITSSVNNQDLVREFLYVLPALSPDVQTRDSVFNALLDERNRVNEVWVQSSLAWLNHPRRRADAEKYITPLLEELQEIQRTGDIFFPDGWLSSGLSGHTSKAAYAAVTAFLEKYPNYPENLKNKILVASDHLRRLHEGNP